MRRRGKDACRRRRLDHLSGLHDDDPIAVSRGKPEVMRDEHRRHAARARQLYNQIHHRLLRRHIEPSRGLIGDEQPRLAGKCHRNDDALAHAARKLERIRVVALLRVADAHQIQDINRLLARVGRRRLDVLQQHVLDLVADLPNRIQSRARILEDHRHLPPAQIPHRPLGSSPDVDAGKCERATANTAGPVQDSHERIRRDRLA